MFRTQPERRRLVMVSEMNFPILADLYCVVFLPQNYITTKYTLGDIYNEFLSYNSFIGRQTGRELTWTVVIQALLEERQHIGVHFMFSHIHLDNWQVFPYISHQLGFYLFEIFGSISRQGNFNKNTFFSISFPLFLVININNVGGTQQSLIKLYYNFSSFY